MKKQFDVYVPKVEHEPDTIFLCGEEKVFVSTTLPDKEIHPEPRVVDLRNQPNI